MHGQIKDMGSCLYIYSLVYFGVLLMCSEYALSASVTQLRARDAY